MTSEMPPVPHNRPNGVSYILLCVQQQLRQYSGATAISSADYFGEEGGGGGGGGGGGSAGGYGASAGAAADDFMNKLSMQVQQDIRGVTQAAGAASRKLGSMLSNLNKY